MFAAAQRMLNANGFTASRCYCGFYARIKGNGPSWDVLTPHASGCFFGGAQ
jgi:hypothetical protein